MLKADAIGHNIKILSYSMICIAVIIPFLKYSFKFPDYVDLFYIVYCFCILVANLDTREPILGGLILLVTIPLLLIEHREKLAETTAIGAYYLLVTGVISQLVSFFREKKGN